MISTQQLKRSLFDFSKLSTSCILRKQVNAAMLIKGLNNFGKCLEGELSTVFDLHFQRRGGKVQTV